MRSPFILLLAAVMLLCGASTSEAAKGWKPSWEKKTKVKAQSKSVKFKEVRTAKSTHVASPQPIASRKVTGKSLNGTRQRYYK